MLVEDDQYTRDELLVLLQRRVASVVAAADGRAGLEAFGEHGPDLIITDLRMPLMDGLTMIGEIRRIDPQVKIVIMTAHSDAEYMLGAIEAGVSHYLMKPVSIDRLDGAIHECSEVLVARKALAQSQREKDELIEKLQQAVAEVQVLSGLLPICAGCKRIRDHRGYWDQIEHYLSQHSQARFSHGLCPECLIRLYPEFAAELPPEGILGSDS